MAHGTSSNSYYCIYQAEPVPQGGFYFCSNSFQRGVMGSLVKMLNFREGKWFVQVTQLEGEWAGIGTTAWMIPKPVFFQETSPFAQPHPCSLQEKSRPDRNAGLRHSKRLRPCPACLPVPALPQISTPLLPDLPGGARHRAAASCWLAPWTRPGPFHPRTPDLHGGAPRTHTVKPLYPEPGSLREQGPAAAGPPPGEGPP